MSQNKYENSSIFINLFEVMLHIKSQQFGDKPKAVAGIPHVAEILHHVDAGLLVEIDRA